MTTHSAIILLTLLAALLGIRMVWNARMLARVPIGMFLTGFACLALFLVFVLFGALLPHAVGAYHRDGWTANAASIFVSAWAGTGTLWLMRLAPKLRPPPDWVARFGWIDIVLLAGIVLPGAYVLARVLP